jgi:hypothetical protein
VSALFLVVFAIPLVRIMLVIVTPVMGQLELGSVSLQRERLTISPREK